VWTLDGFQLCIFNHQEKCMCLSLLFLHMQLFSVLARPTRANHSGIFLSCSGILYNVPRVLSLHPARHTSALLLDSMCLLAAARSPMHKLL
jgi:hypothetical protein